ncbi:MAG: hypothetical protein ACE5IM_10140 [Nitrospinota bacterium]
MPRNLSKSAGRRARLGGGVLPAMFLAAFALAAAGCASVATVEGRAQAVRAGEEAIAIEAVSFRFRPNRVLASAGASLRFDVKNASSLAHNLTVEMPDGKTRRKTVRLPAAGEYVIYCNKPGHRAFGMKGVLVAR